MTCSWLSIASSFFYKSNFNSSDDVDEIVAPIKALMKLIQAGECVMHVECNVAHPLHIQSFFDKRYTTRSVNLTIKHQSVSSPL